VKVIISISLCAVSESPISLPLPVTKLKAPFGKEVCEISSVRNAPDSEPFVAGLNTTVLPANNAGAIFESAKLIG